jgi:hypothetical protein
MCVMGSASELEVVEPVRAARGERDPVVNLQAVAAAADDAPVLVAPSHLIADSSPFPS